jgi:hypothetical protein
MNTRKILVASAVLNVSLATLLVFYWKTPATPAPATGAEALVLPRTLSSSPATNSSPLLLPATKRDEAASPVLSSSAAPAPVAPIVAAAMPAPEIRFVPPQPEPISGNQPAQKLTGQSASSLPQEGEGIAVDSSRSGNAIHFRGMRVAVATNYGTNNAGQPTLAVDVTPDIGPMAEASADSSVAGNVASSSGSFGSDTRLASTDISTPPPASATTDPTAVKKSRLRVFSDEDNAVRTEWGWAAWDRMRREADAEGSN